MPSAETATRDESIGLSSSRAEFASSLPRRLESVLGALSALEQQPDSVGRRDNFLRRVHALGASAKVLGFAAATDVFSRAEQQIRTSQVDTIADDILAVKKYLAALPTLVLRGPYSLAPQPQPTSGHPSALPLISEPLAVLAWCTPELLELLYSLDRSGNALELTTASGQNKLLETCIALGPDVLLLDANQGSITLLVDELAQATEAAHVAIVVANVPEEAAPGLLELGARVVLPVRCNEQQLARALLQARRAPVERAPTPSPIGEVSLKDLAERLAQEIREGLVDAAVPNAHIERIDLGEGTPIRAALWSALAQIREHIVENSDGRVQFVAGPEGSVPLAPRATGSARGAGRINVDLVDLSGRRILVVDDDPAVVWFVGGTLRAAGAVVIEAHDGTQAFDLACRLWPELIVSDVMMPGLDGFALCHAVKRDVLLRDIPIVLLSWKEDLLFRLRDLGADADGYLRKEATASTIVCRVKELLLSRSVLEQRLASDREIRGRLDGTTVRLLLELAAALDRPVRLALRVASALYDIRLRNGSLVSITRTRNDATVEHGQSVLGALLGTTAGRFSIVTDRDPCNPMFTGSLREILGPCVLRARAAQRILSGLRLGFVDSLTLEPDAFGSELPMLPMSLQPIADELLRGTAPRQLLASGVASVQLLESLLSDVARRGAVRAIADAQGEDLLEQEILELSSVPASVAPKPAAPPPLFTFQLSPAAPEVSVTSTEIRGRMPADLPGEYVDVLRAPTSPTPTLAPASTTAVEWQGKGSHSSEPEATWDLPSGTLSGVGHDTKALGASITTTRSTPESGSSPTTKVSILPSITTATQSLPASKAPPVDDVDWAMEFNWDSTPPPQGPGAKIATESTESKPSTSGGFMRPTIATLERRQLQVMPDLANAVVLAVAEATPFPAANGPATSSQRVATATPMDFTPDEARVDRGLVATEGSVLGVSPPGTEPRLPTDASHTEPQTRATSDSQAAATAGINAGLAGDKTVPAPPRGDRNAATPQLSDKVAPTLHHVETTVTAATPSTDATTVGPDRAPKAPIAGIDRTAFAESPSALPVVHQPPRPKAQVSVGLVPPSPMDREVEDPVFPLVSTANVSVEVQRSIDVGPPALEVGQANRQTKYESLPPSDLTSLDPKPVENRDTLRSPESTNREAAKPLPDAAIAAAPRAPALPDAAIAAAPRAQVRADPGNGNAPATDPLTSPVKPISSERQSTAIGPVAATTSDGPSSKARTSSDPGPAAQQPRPVGWIQALGLAALAGIVTFAATVPIASWIRKRHEPLRTEPPVAIETMASSTAIDRPTTPQGVASSTPLPTASSGVTVDGANTPAASAQPAPARTEEIPVPADVLLQPNQALIEVLTGGGHAIFLDDSFVGRGPVRVVTVQPGRHIVRTRLNGVERSDAIDVGAGRSLRLSLEEAWK